MWGLPWWLSSKESISNSGDGFDPWVKKFSWRRAWQPTPALQYSCLENVVDKGPWQATVHKVANVQT